MRTSVEVTLFGAATLISSQSSQRNSDAGLLRHRRDEGVAHS